MIQNDRKSSILQKTLTHSLSFTHSVVRFSLANNGLECTKKGTTTSKQGYKNIKQIPFIVLNSSKF